MGTRISKFTDMSKGTISKIESKLSGALRPIKPSKEFVHGMAQRIRTKPRVAFVERISNWHVVAILVAGLVSLTVFLAVLGRALVSLVYKKRPTKA